MPIMDIYIEAKTVVRSGHHSSRHHVRNLLPPTQNV